VLGPVQRTRIAGTLLAVVLSACPGPARPPATVSGDAVSPVENGVPRHPDEVRRPYGVLGTQTGLDDARGKPARIPCRVCHDLLEPREENRYAVSIGGFHRGIRLAHGDLTCRSCHEPPLFQGFRLQDGRPVDYPDVMRLCAQCHGLQHRDFQRGLHGGMNGYWDRQAGPRVRNHCLVCHNPHRPAFPPMIPAPLPRSRFQEGPSDDAEAASAPEARPAMSPADVQEENHE